MRLLLLPAVAVLAVACASNPQPATQPGASIETTRIQAAGAGTSITATHTPTANVTEVAAPMDRAWATLRAVYDSVGIPVATMDASQHLLGNTGFKLRRKLGSTPLSRYLDCGAAQGGPNAETYEVFLAVATQLVPAATPGRVVATTSVQASAKPVSFAGEYVNCASNGALEAKIGQMLMLNLING